MSYCFNYLIELKAIIAKYVSIIVESSYLKTCIKYNIHGVNSSFYLKNKEKLITKEYDWNYPVLGNIKRKLIQKSIMVK